MTQWQSKDGALYGGIDNGSLTLSVRSKAMLAIINTKRMKEYAERNRSS